MKVQRVKGVRWLQEGAVFADQFENMANMRAHLRTGQEIWEQTQGRLDAFVSGAGTGGTVAGVSSYLKSRKPSVKVLEGPPFPRGGPSHARILIGSTCCTSFACLCVPDFPHFSPFLLFLPPSRRSSPLLLVLVLCGLLGGEGRWRLGIRLCPHESGGRIT